MKSMFGEIKFCLAVVVILAWLQGFVWNIVAKQLQEPILFQVVRPRSVAYYYKAVPARHFGGTFSGSTPRTAFIVPAYPSSACENLKNAAELNGVIVLVERGGCSFVSKALRAQTLGAAGIIIYDNTDENFHKFIDMIDDSTGRSYAVDIPALFILGRDGHRLRNALQEEGLGAIEIRIPFNITQNPELIHYRPPWSLY